MYNKTKRCYFSRSRILYSIFLLTFVVIFILRFACEKLDCAENIIAQFINNNRDSACKSCEKAKDKNNIYCIECEKLKPDWKVRDGFDEAGLILLGICSFFLILICKNYDVRHLIKSITKLSLFGAVEFELEKLEKEIIELENKEVGYEIRSEEFNLQEKLLINSTNSSETLSLISIEIEKILEQIYNVNSLSRDNSPISQQKLLEHLYNKKLIDEDISKIIAHFFYVKYQDAIIRNGKNTIALIELGERILTILSQYTKKMFWDLGKFWGKIKDIKIDRSKVEEISPEKIVLFTTVSVSNSTNNYFPLEGLTLDNFSIFETSNGVEKQAKIIKVEPLEESLSQINISIILDCSESMGTDNKLDKSKEAVISFLNSLKVNANLKFRVAVYFVSSEIEAKSETFFAIEEFQNLIETIKTIKASGNTPLWQTLNNVIENCSKNKVLGEYQIMICLTDGKDSGETEYTYDKIKNKVTEAAIPFVFIGYGDEDYSNLTNLSELSGAGNSEIGHFIGVNAKKIEYIFKNIARSITKSYKLYWKPLETTKNTEINVRIKIKYKSLYGKVSKEDFVTYKLNH